MLTALQLASARRLTERVCRGSHPLPSPGRSSASRSRQGGPSALQTEDFTLILCASRRRRRRGFRCVEIWRARRSAARKQPFPKRRNSSEMWPETSPTHEWPLLPKEPRSNFHQHQSTAGEHDHGRAITFLTGIGVLVGPDPRTLGFPRRVCGSGMFRFALLSTLLG